MSRQTSRRRSENPETPEERRERMELQRIEKQFDKFERFVGRYQNRNDFDKRFDKFLFDNRINPNMTVSIRNHRSKFQHVLSRVTNINAFRYILSKLDQDRLTPEFFWNILIEQLNNNFEYIEVIDFLIPLIVPYLPYTDLEILNLRDSLHVMPFRDRFVKFMISNGLPADEKLAMELLFYEKNHDLLDYAFKRGAPVKPLIDRLNNDINGLNEYLVRMMDRMAESAKEHNLDYDPTFKSHREVGYRKGYEFIDDIHRTVFMETFQDRSNNPFNGEFKNMIRSINSVMDQIKYKENMIVFLESYLVGEERRKSATSAYDNFSGVYLPGIAFIIGEYIHQMRASPDNINWAGIGEDRFVDLNGMSDIDEDSEPDLDEEKSDSD